MDSKVDKVGVVLFLTHQEFHDLRYLTRNFKKLLEDRQGVGEEDLQKESWSPQPFSRTHNRHGLVRDLCKIERNPLQQEVPNNDFREDYDGAVGYYDKDEDAGDEENL